MTLHTFLRTKANSGFQRTQNEPLPFATPFSRSISRRPSENWFFSRRWVLRMPFYMECSIALTSSWGIGAAWTRLASKANKVYEVNFMMIQSWLKERTLRERTCRKRIFIYTSVRRRQRVQPFLAQGRRMGCGSSCGYFRWLKSSHPFVNWLGICIRLHLRQELDMEVLTRSA